MVGHDKNRKSAADNSAHKDKQCAPVPAPTLTTKEEWWEFVRAKGSERPQLPSGEELASWNRAGRRAFNETRGAYHDNFGVVGVPAMRRIHKDLLPRVISNARRLPGARRGAIIDGPGGAGKTTIITQLGKKVERYMRARYPSPRTRGGDEFMPVVYITLPASTTIRGLNLALARFYGIVSSKRDTKDELGYQIIEHARRCATCLIMVDDIHFLNLYKQRDHHAVNDHLKYLANTISTTFLYAGIDCERSGLLSEGRSPHEGSSSQTRRRFALHHVEPFSLKTKNGPQEWVSLLKNIERKLVLEHARKGTLHNKLAGYLFERTGGYIGSLTDLVRGGANLAIESGEERITKNLLERVQLDHAAEAGSQETA